MTVVKRPLSLASFAAAVMRLMTSSGLQPSTVSPTKGLPGPSTTTPSAPVSIAQATSSSRKRQRKNTLAFIPRSRRMVTSSFATARSSSETMGKISTLATPRSSRAS